MYFKWTISIPSSADSWSASSSPAHTPGSIGGRYYFCADTNDYYYGTTNLGTRSRSPSPNPHIPRFGGIRCSFCSLLHQITNKTNQHIKKTKWSPFWVAQPFFLPYILNFCVAKWLDCDDDTGSFKIWTRQSDTKSKKQIIFRFLMFFLGLRFLNLLFGLSIQFH